MATGEGGGQASREGWPDIIARMEKGAAIHFLKGERGLTTAHIKALRKRLGVGADLLV